MLSTAINALVYQHLLKVAPEVAAEFKSRYECYSSQTNVSIKDLISSYNTTIFANSLVHKHLCKVSPNLVKYFKLHRTTCEESLDNLVLYEKINSKKRKWDALGERSKSNLKVEKTENEVFVEGEFSDTDLLMKELEKYHPCFASSESESEIEDDISVISQVETSAKITCTKNTEPPKNKLLTDLSEEDINGFCHILDCGIYKDLRERLGIKTCLDKLASHILKKNILVRKIHQKLTTTSSQLHKYISREILANGTIKFGHFNPKENSLIETNWNKLLEESNLCEFSKDALDIFRPSLARKTTKDALKCNVIGLYLSTGMTKVRYTSDVFAQAKIVLTAKSRKLTLEEKDFLVEYVDQHGENCDWKELAYTLYKRHVRKGADTIKKIYFAMKNVGKRGKFKLEEDKIILDLMFSENRPNSVNSDSFKEPADSLKVLSKQLNRREVSIYRHWFVFLKPLLLQYHAGTLHLNIKYLFLNYLNDKKVTYLQDIQWSEVLSQPQFAGHTRLSLAQEFNNMKNTVFLIKKCEITVPEMVDFMNDKHRQVKGNEENAKNGKRWQRTNEIIKYYKNLVDEKPKSASKLSQIDSI